MNKAACLVGAAVILGSMAGPVEARVVRYRIDGKAYSYDTRDRQQVERARQRIAAAKAAYAARIRADAELASNPVVKVLGSPAQNEAAAAQARFEQVLSEEEPTAAPAAPVGAPGQRPTGRKVAGANSGRPPSAMKTRPNRTIVRERARFALNAGPDEPRPPAEPPSRAGPEATTDSGPEWTSSQEGPKPTLKSVTFDLSSGIKSVQMTDGTIREEPLDSSMVSTLRALEPAAASLNAFVEKVWNSRPLDLTVTPSDRTE